jgi:hypothetical protein
MANHPLQILGFKPLTHSLADLGFHVQRTPANARDTRAGQETTLSTTDPAMKQEIGDESQIFLERIPQANRSEDPDHAMAQRAIIAGHNNQPVEAAAGPRNTAAPFDSTNSGHERTRIQKGSRVTLANGTQARVEYVDPNMRIVRVRTAEGRNVTLRRKDLRGVN